MVSFELGKEIDKEKRGTKKKVCVPTRKRTSDLRIPLYDALPLSPRESTAGEIYYEAHMTHGDSEFFFCATLMTRRKTSLSISLPSVCFPFL